MDKASVRGTEEPALVQRQLSGPELAVGLVRDDVFGPLVTVASGGTGLDLWADRTYLVPPLTHEDVRAALSGLRTWPLLTGLRGRALDVDATVEVVMAVGRLALERPDVQEVDLSPVVITAEGPVCVDARVRVSTSGATKAGGPGDGHATGRRSDGP